MSLQDQVKHNPAASSYFNDWTGSKKTDTEQ